MKKKLLSLLLLFFCSFTDLGQREQIGYEQIETDEATLAEEPPILGLIASSTILLKDSSVVLNEHFAPHNEISTQSGIDLFSPFNDGIRVKNSGLYRVSYFQSAFSQDVKSQLLFSLMLTPGNYRKRYKLVTIEPNSSNDIEFIQILRIKEGQKVQLVVRPVYGTTRLGVGSESSGFTIEKIGN